MASLQRLPIGVTLGDPAGIGPEIVAKALLRRGAGAPLLPIGQPDVLARALADAGSDLRVRPIARIGQVSPAAGLVDILVAGETDPPCAFGLVSATAGRAAYAAIRAGIEAARGGEIAALVTAPIHKEALAAAGVPYPGHTEMLADFGGAQSVAMMLANAEIRTVLVTIHCALREAIDRADFPAQMSAIRLAHAGARALGVAHPRVAVAGLNPHAGEGGLFGREEVEIIAPAIAAARSEGIDASGPWPGDTVFMRARAGAFDVVVAQYHDQGLIPVKYLGVAEGVNITLGLPFIRTSPDHGTAFDIAGRGLADPRSLETAIAYAERLIAAR